MPNRLVNLGLERARTLEQWQGAGEVHAPLALAAAYTFHQYFDASSDIVTPLIYKNNLNIVAAALSRFLPIYALIDPEEGPVALPVDLTMQRFATGGAELRCNDGFFFTGLLIRRADLAPVLPLINRAGLPFCD